MTPRMLLVVRLWPWVLALLVLAPTLAPGYVLSYDMVFVPDLAMRPDFLGLGSGLPRAVPSDAVVAVLDELVPGSLLQKILLVGALVLAGAGARRLVSPDSAVAQLAATSLYVWNPYVAERLGIGHWPLLLAYASLPWVFDSARRLRAGERNLPFLVLWLALAALSASGGVMAALVALCGVLGADRAGLRRGALVLAAAVTVNAPWIVAGLLHRQQALSDPAAVQAFAAGGEGYLPMPLAALGLGGVWNLDVVPASRSGWGAVIGLVLVLAVCAAGWRGWAAWLPGRDRVALLVPAAVGLLVAATGAFVPQAIEWLVAAVPGGGLFRDGARYLGLLAPLEAGLFGMGAAALSALMRHRVAAVALAVGSVLLPLAVMPDLAWGLAGALRPVHYPQEYAEAREALAARLTDEEGAVLVLPFTSYRAPSWNHGRPVLDPVGRYLPADYLASDVLYVSGRRISGEDARARRVERALTGASSADLGATLAAEDLAWVVVDLDAQRALGRADSAKVPVGSSVYEGRQIGVWSLQREAAHGRHAAADLLMIGAAWTVSSGLVLFCLCLAAWRRVRGGPKGPVAPPSGC